MKCTYCGSESSDPSATFCTMCGAPMTLSDPVPVAPPVSAYAPPAPDSYYGVAEEPSSPVAVAPPVAVAAPPAPVAPPVAVAAPPAPVAPPVSAYAPPTPDSYYGVAEEPSSPVAVAAPAFAPSAPEPYAQNMTASQAFPPATPYPVAPVGQPAFTGAYPGAMPPPAPVSPICVQCGAPIPAGMMFCTRCGAPAPPPQPAKPPKKKMSKGTRAAIISVISLVVVVAIGLGSFLIIRDSNYKKAVDLMNDGQYLEAQEAFEAKLIADYKDSAENAAFCRNSIIYEEADAALADRNYEKALSLFGQIPGFKDDVNEKHQFCQDFIDAIALFDEGSFWKARVAFGDLTYSVYDNGDASEWRDRCKQTTPGTGILERGTGFKNGEIPFLIQNKSYLYNVYVEIYTADNDFWCSIFVGADDFQIILLPSGSYSLNIAKGLDWYGTKDYFGEGLFTTYAFPYVQNGKSVFDFTSSQGYTLTP